MEWKEKSVSSFFATGHAWLFVTKELKILIFFFQDRIENPQKQSWDFCLNDVLHGI